LAHAVFSPILEESNFADDKASALSKSWKNLKPFDQQVIKQARLVKIYDRIHKLFWELVDLSLDNEIRNANC
jgi:uncharacterized protein YdcH (DUF465 family)